MLHVDTQYAILVFFASVGLVVALLAIVECVYQTIQERRSQSAGFACLFVITGAALLAAAAYHSGQTYHPCKTDFSTMKQECK